MPLCSSLRNRPALPASVVAFTVLEIVMVLAIVVLIIGAATPEITSMIRGEQLKSPARQLEAMAITARSSALAEQRPYQIILRADGFHLERPGEVKELARFELSREVALEMANWPEEKWHRPKHHVWYFPPSGLCEPIRVMFRKGDSYFLQKYSAVTGWNQEESFVIR